MKTAVGRLLSFLCTLCITLQAATVTGKNQLILPGKQLSQAGNKVLINAALEEYTGTFDFADFPSMEIYIYSGELYAETSRGKSVLKKTKEKDMFEIVDYQALLKFNRDEKNRIISIELNAQGFTSTGTRRKSTD